MEVTFDVDEYIRSANDNPRPQSAMSQSTRPGSAMAKQTEVSMRGTMYSNMGQENPGERKIVEFIRLSNILELTEQERSIVNAIKRIMEEECDRLQLDIDEIQS